MTTKTTILLAAFSVMLAAPVAHAERYSVRNAKGQFAKQTASATAPTTHTASAAQAGEGLIIHEAATPAASPKGTLSGWLRRNFTIRQSSSDSMVAAKALGENGRMAEAAHTLGHADAPQGFFERIALGHADAKLNRAANAQLKDSARSSDFHGTGDAVAAMTTMRAKGKTTFFSRWRASVARKDGMKATLKIASKQGKGGDFESASSSLDLAASLSSGKGRALARGERTYVAQATKAAQRAAKNGDIDGTMKALQVAINAPGSTLDQSDAKAIFDRAFDNAIPKMLQASKAAYRAGDHQAAAEQLAEVIRIQEEQGSQPTGSVRRQQVAMTALVGRQANAILAAHAEAPAAETAKNTVVDPGKAEAKQPEQLELFN